MCLMEQKSMAQFEDVLACLESKLEDPYLAHRILVMVKRTSFGTGKIYSYTSKSFHCICDPKQDAQTKDSIESIIDKEHFNGKREVRV